jgi:hypothetical protein
MGISEVESKYIKFEDLWAMRETRLHWGLNGHAGKRTADMRRIEAE